MAVLVALGLAQAGVGVVVLMELLLDATGEEDGVGVGERPAERHKDRKSVV